MKKTDAVHRLYVGCGERGIIFNDPVGRTLQSQFTPIFVSLIWVFIFQIASFRQVRFSILKNKNPSELRE
jgi:TM2 domain-containing membrane protein YozV